MNIIISNSSNIPIYEQIKEAIKKAIANQEINENEILPSIRNLAQSLRVSVLTVKKAYDELEQEGFISTIQGKGSYIAPRNAELLKESRLKDIEKHLDTVVTIAKISHIRKEEILELLEYLYGEES